MTGMQQAVFDLYFGQGLTQDEVADQLRLTQSAVSMRLRRARDRYLAAGMGWPPNPGAGLRTVFAASLYNEN